MNTIRGTLRCSKVKQALDWEELSSLKKGRFGDPSGIKTSNSYKGLAGEYLWLQGWLKGHTFYLPLFLPL